MIWYETRPLILTTGYKEKKMPPGNGKELFIFPLFLLLFRNVPRVRPDADPFKEIRERIIKLV